MLNKIIIFLTSFCALLLPVKPLVLIAVCIVLLDTAVGVYAVIKKEGRKSFRSGKLFNMIPKIFFYSFSIVLAFLIDKFIFSGILLSIPFLLSKSVCVLAVTIEVISIDENSQKLGNRPILDIIKNLVIRLKGFKKDLNELNK